MKKTALVTLTADLVVLYEDMILLIQRRKYPYAGYWALPGGKMDNGESIEQCAVRELSEETGIHITVSDLRLLGVFSNPGRDPRGTYVSVAYAVLLPDFPTALAGDDAVAAQWFYTYDLPPLAFDHDEVIRRVFSNNF